MEIAGTETFVQELHEKGFPEAKLHTASQLGCYFSFAVVVVLYAYAELLAYRASKLKLRYEDESEEPQAGQDCNAPSAGSSAPGGNAAPEKLFQIAPVRCLLGHKDVILQCRSNLRTWTELGLILALFYFTDRSGLVSESGKKYDRDLFFSIFLTLSFYGLYCTLKQSKVSSPLNREQTEEWKGWMQVLFLLYHYYKASEMYNAIRIFIAAYVWMTGFGNFSYYHVRKDFSIGRFMQMMWRLNFFVCFCCLCLGNSYVLYYICPMHTLFTLLVYFSLIIGKEYNNSTPTVLIKLAALTALVYIVWEVPGVFQGIFRPFTFLFAYTDPKKPSMEPLHEWFFRSGLDRYVWIYGMACAFFHPRYEMALKWLEDRPVGIRLPVQIAVGAATLCVGYWWYTEYYLLPKLEYNKVHPYTSWIPISCFIILRNLTPQLRINYMEIFCVCGKITLETYISQFHIWLSTTNVPDGQPGKLMELIPGYPLINFGVCSIIYVGISQRVFTITNDLKNSCVPNGNNKMLMHNIIFACMWSVVALAIGWILEQAF